MPFLRVLRDKRGYETTYLMHWFRDGHRQRSRILYVFRTPPGVRVGRQVLEPAVMRELEALHPEIEFEWKTLIDNQQVVETSVEPRRSRKRRQDEDEPASTSEPGAEPAKQPPAAEERAPAVQAQRPAPAAAQPPRTPIPVAIEGSTPQDQIVWLRSWYARIRERIPHRTHDAARREVLFALAERLNPDAWLGDEAVAAGLIDAAEALQRFSRVFAKRRRRSPRNARPAPVAEGPGGS